MWLRLACIMIGIPQDTTKRDVQVGWGYFPAGEEIKKDTDKGSGIVLQLY